MCKIVHRILFRILKVLYTQLYRFFIGKSLCNSFVELDTMDSIKMFHTFALNI